MRTTAGVGGKPRIVGQVGTIDDLLGHPLPLAVVSGAEHDGLTIAGGKRPVRRHRGRAHPQRLLVDARVLRVGQCVAHDIGHHVEQAELNRRRRDTLGTATACEQQRQDRDRRVKPSGEVGHRRPRLGGHPGVAGDGA